MSSKAEYLKKYLEPTAEKNKKKKKKRKGNIAIIDNDVSWDDMKSRAELELEGENAPTVASVIDDRPEELRKKQDGWKAIGKNSDRSPKRKSRPARKERSPKKPEKSPKRKSSSPRRKRLDSDTSPPRRRRIDSDSSPPRKKRVDSDSSPPRKKVDSDSSSPPRKRVDSESPPRRRRVDSDESPPRRTRVDSDESPPRRSRIDSDESPPRRGRVDSDESPLRKPRAFDSGSDSDSGKNGKMADGSKAGLNSKEDWVKGRPKKTKKSNMAQLIEDAKNQETVYREKGTGKKRDFKAEEEMTEAERLRKEEEVKNYKVWNKGKKQLEKREENIRSYMKEIEKPLARYKDDKDYNDMKKDEMHAEDPMAAYIQSKKKTKTKKTRQQAAKPSYAGSSTCPNRFAISPGYRWDGVDRGTGYETKLFKYLNEKKHRVFEAWRANTDDF